MVATALTLPALRQLFGAAPVVNYRLAPKPSGKTDKIPITPQGDAASTTNPTTWTTFDAAAAAVGNPNIDGLSRVLAPLVGIDIDDCRNPETGELTPFAQDVVNAIPSYWEVSQSKRGLRGFAYGHIPRRGRRDDDLGLEVYMDGRHLTVTGDHLDGTADHIAYCHATLNALYVQYFPEKAKVSTPATPPAATEPTSGPLNDTEVQAKLFGASNGATMRALWDGEPDANGGQSGGDLALCNELAFYAGEGNEAQVDRLFRQSARMRPKWDEKRGPETYGEMTIRKAYEGRTGFYAGRAPTPIKLTVTLEPPAATVDCPDLQARIAELEAELAERNRRIAQLEQENAQLVDERTVIVGVLRNQELNATERIVALNVVFNVHAAKRQGKAEDAGAKVYIPALAESAGCSPNRASAAIKRLATYGAIKRDVRRGIVEVVDRETGEITIRPTSLLYVDLPGGSVAESLRPIAALKPEEAPKRGGARLRCPDHPAAGTVTTCKECWRVLAESSGSQSDGLREEVATAPVDTTYGAQNEGLDSEHLPDVQDERLAVSRPNRYVHVRRLTRCDSCGKQASVQDLYGATWCNACAPPLEELDLAEVVG